MARVAELAVQAEKTEVVMIAGKTYANRNLVRYDTPKKAAAIHTHTLVSLLEYIEKCAGEFAGKKMTIHVESLLYFRVGFRAWKRMPV